MAEKKKLRRMEIESAENGGHTVTHHYKEMPSHSSKHGIGMSYVEPERHVFGPENGYDMIAHIANHLGVPEQDAAGEGAQDGEDEE